MEGELVRIRRRVPRKRTLGERVKKAVEMPRLSRAKRNQRVAIVAMVLLLGVYLLVWPTISGMFGGTSSSSSPASPRAASVPHIPGKKK